MTADFRALCQELIDAIDSGISSERIKQSPLAVCVDAALAQPEPQGVEPTDEELMSLYGVTTSCYHGFLVEEFRQELDFARAVLALAQPEPQGPGPTDEDLYDLADVFNGDPVPAMRRALELWGRSAVKPVPVSERLPGAKDVEPKVRYCWWCNCEDMAWYYCDASHCDPTVYTHWLPHWALQIPKVNNTGKTND